MRVPRDRREAMQMDQGGSDRRPPSTELAGRELSVLGAVWLALAIATPVLSYSREAVFAIIIAGALILTRTRSGRARPTAAGALYLLTFSVGLARGSDNQDFRFSAAILAIAPIAFVLGRRIGTDPRASRAIFRTFLGLAVAAAVLALLERAGGDYLFRGSYFIDSARRGGELRARAFLPQTLVLAWFCVVAVPFAASRELVRDFAVRASLVSLLIAGALSTGSRSSIAWLLIGTGTAVAVSSIQRTRAAGALAPALLLVILIAAGPSVIRGISESSAVSSSDPVVASAEYRTALYGQLSSELQRNPLGTGMGRIPIGHLVIPTALGPIDASKTVDSEYVFAAIRFGLLGVAFWAAVSLGVIRRIGTSVRALHVATITGLAFGSILALEVWIPIVALLAILLGISHSDLPHRSRIGHRGQRATVDHSGKDSAAGSAISSPH
ncbi:O-antigen ligase family protein [Nocardioides sp. TRM66260-LWL]|uniref:O-antigen ligase family protein n=1 Tax=Nocardioides sp. TRM66260-LWL TaxID=2874478 RepID=UPI0035ADEB1D